MPKGVPKLKLCPFCGRAPTYHSDGKKGGARWIACDNRSCAIQPSTAYANVDAPPICRKVGARKRAILAWNTRVGESISADEMKAVKARTAKFIRDVQHAHRETAKSNQRFGRLKGGKERGFRRSRRAR